MNQTQSLAKTVGDAATANSKSNQRLLDVANDATIVAPAEWVKTVSTASESVVPYSVCEATSGWRLPVDRNVLAGFSARRCLVTLLLGLAMLSGAVANAQTVITLVSNVEQLAHGGGTQDITAQSFRTGNRSAGYTLSAVELWPYSPKLASERSGTYVTIKNDNNGQPGTLLATLSDPTNDFNGQDFQTYTAPANTTLQANTTYWVVVNEGREAVDRLGWGPTQSDDEDVASLPNWSIGDSRVILTGGSWSGSQTRVLLMDIRGFGNGKPALSISGGSAKTEGTPIQFTVTLDDLAEDDVTVQYDTSDDTATAGTDYTAATAQTLTIPAGQISATIDIETLADLVDEDDETFAVVLSNPSSNAVLAATTSATGTINDDIPTLSIADAAATEGSNVDFTVTASYAVSDDITVEYRTRNNTSRGETAGNNDFTRVTTNETLTIVAGQTTGIISIATGQDSRQEDDETFGVRLLNPSSNSKLSASPLWVTGTILDDDTPSTEATLSLSATSVAEDASATTVTVTATLDKGALNADVDLTIAVGATADSATEGTDYTSVDDFTLTINAGQTTGTETFDITPVDDVLSEDDEEVSVTGTTGAGLTVTGTKLTIVDNEVASTEVALSVNVESVLEDAATSVTVTATLNSAPLDTATPVLVSVGATNDTATDGTDYLSVTSFTINISAGQTSNTGTFTLTPLNDDIDEADESITIGGSAQGFSITTDEITITDDDVRGLTFAPSTVSVPEDDSSTYTVVLDSQPTAGVTVTMEGMAGTDLTLDKTSLSFMTSNWDTPQVVTVSAANDSDQLDDTVTLTHIATGGDYVSFNKDLEVTVADDDLAAIIEDGVEVRNIPISSTYGFTRNEIIDITVTFDRAVDVDTSGGVPSIKVRFDQPAALRDFEYAYGSGSTELVFQYKVVQGDLDNNGFVIRGNGLTLNGGTIKDAAQALDADLSHPAVTTLFELTGSFSINDIDITSLALSGITLSPSFNRNTTSYTATVDNDVSQTRVSATGEGESTVTILPADADTNAAGHQVTLNAGANVITVSATQNGVTGNTYTVTVTRSAASVSINATVSSAVYRLEDLVFTVTRSETSAQPLNVDLSITQDQAFLGTGKLTQNVTIGANQSSATLTLRRDDFSSTVSADGSLTVTVDAGDGYVPTNPVSASVDLVVANPAITMHFEEATYEFFENAGAVTLNLLAETAPSVPAPTSVPLRLLVAAYDDSAGKDTDFDFQPSTTVISPSDFMQSGDQFVASKELTVTLLDDNITEGEESFELRLSGIGLPNVVEITLADGSACSSNCGTTVTIIDDESPPAQVTGVTVTPNNGALTLNWTNVAGATGYKVQWKSGAESFADASTDNREATIASGSTTSHRISGLTNGVTYTVRVLATRTGAPSDGEASAEVTGTPFVPELTITDASEPEGDDLVFTVTLSVVAETDVTVEYATTDGTATSDSNHEDGADFTPPASGAELTISAGQTSGSITIATAQDSVAEDDETFTLTLSNASSNAALGTQSTATGTIEDDDTVIVAPTISAIAFTNAPSDGIYGLDDVIEVSVTFDAALDVTGSPRIPLLLSTAPVVDRFALYIDSASSDTVLVFRRTVSAAFDDMDAIGVAANALELNGGSIVVKDESVAAILTHGALTGGNIRTRVVDDVAISSDPAVTTPAGYYGAGETIEFTVTFAETVSVNTSSGTPALIFSASDGPQQEAGYVSGSGSTDLVFNWTVPADVPGNETPIEIPTNIASGGALLSDAGLVLKLGTIRDSNARDVNIRHGEFNTTSSADTTAPVITEATVNGTELVVSFERTGTIAEYLDENSVPAVGDFEVSIVGSGVQTASNVAVSGAAVTLTLSNPVGHAYAVALSYVPGTNPLQDLWGNDVAGFSNHTVTNNSPEPQLSVEDVIVDEDAGTADFTISLDVASYENVTVDYRTEDDTAVAGSDYTASSDNLMFLSNELSKTVQVTLTDDSISEGSETFKLILTNETNASIADGEAIATITDDDGTSTVTVANSRATEGDAVSFTVSVNPVSSTDVTVEYATTDGTALANSDYTAAASDAELTISAGQTSGTIDIATTDDSTEEVDESFTLTLSNPSDNAVLGTQVTATGTIADNDITAATISNIRFSNTPTNGVYNLGDVIEVTVRFNKDVAVTGTPRVKVTQLIGHYHYIYPEYAAASSTDRVLVFQLPVTDEIDDSADGLRIAADSLQLNSGTIRNKGTTVNADRSHALVLSTLNVSTRWITDVDVTSTPNVSAAVTGNPVYGTGETINFTVTFSENVTVDQTSGDPKLQFIASNQGRQTATYASGSGSTELVFNWTVPADVPGDEQQFELPTNVVFEGIALLTNSGFVLNGATIRDSNARDVNIRHGEFMTNASADTTGPTLMIDAAGAIVEGSQLILTFERNAGEQEHFDETSVPAVTDFAVQVQSTARNVSTVTVDGATVTLTLADPVLHGQTVSVGYTPGTNPLKDLWNNNAAGFTGHTVRNDSSEPQLSIADETVREGDGTVEFSVTLDIASSETVTVDYETDDRTALAGSDYTATLGTLTFAAGDMTKTFEVTVADDAVLEVNEEFEVKLKNATNASFADDNATATIIDNETSTLTIADAGDSEGMPISFNVTLDPVAVADVTVQYATNDGTATADSNHEDGADYTAPASGAELTISAGQTAGTISIATLSDTIYEADETFTVTLSNPSSNAVLGTNKTATGTIENDDAGSTDTALKSLSITVNGSEIELTPAFEAGVFSYEGEVANTVESVKVTVDTNHANAVVAIEGDDDTTTPKQADLALAFGENEFAVTVTAEDGVSTKDYEIKLTRELARVDWGREIYSIEEDSGDVEMTITLSPVLKETVTVEYTTADNLLTVTAGEDYTATDGTLTFEPGDTEKTITVTVLDDNIYEPNGAGDVSLILRNPTGPVSFRNNLPFAYSTLTMSGGDNPLVPGENDVAPTVTMDNIDVDEDAGTMEFTLELSHGVEAEGAYRTSTSHIGGTATVGSDYERFTDPVAALLQIPVRATSVTLTVNLIDDDIDEEDETLTIEWIRFNAQTATSSIDVTATIRDDDERGVTLSHTTLDFAEGESGTYTIVLNSQPTGNVVVTPVKRSGDVEVTVSGPLTFTTTTWDVAQTVTVSAAHDTDALNDEAVIGHTVSGADYGTNSVTASDLSVEVDDDELPTVLELNVDAIAADGRVNIAEHGSGFAISGNTGSVGGVEVTVRVGETELTATSADADPASWSVDVAGSASYVTSPSVAVAVSAVKSGYTSPAAVEVDLTVDLTAPTAPSYTSPAALKVGVALTAMEASGGVGIDVYGVTDLPSGLSLDTGTGTISGTPDTANALASSATVTVSDAAGNGATVAVAFPAVSKGDQTLSGFRYSASAVAFGSSAPTVTAPTGVETTLSYSATTTTVCSVDAQTGALSLLEAGECVITATAAGTADYNEAQVTYTVTVQATGALVLNVDAITADGRVNIAEHGSGFAISGNTGSVGGVEVTVRVGETELTATSADADPASWSVDIAGSASYVTSPSVAVAVSAVKSGYTSPAAVEVDLTVDLTAPTAPSYTSPAALKVGVALTAMEASGGVGIDVYGVTDLPSGLSLDTGTGTISGTPDTANALASSATVTVSDAAGNGATVAVAFPAVSKGDQTLSGFRYSASAVAFGSSAPTVTAPTGVETTLSYSATPTTVCSVDAQTGALSLLEAGECVITATAAGTADYNEAQVTYTVTVQATGALVLNVDAITADGRVNIAEHGSGFAISGNTGSVGGVEVTVRVGETELTATSADADPASWSVDIAGSASYVTSPSVAVAVSAVKSGYTSPAAVEVDLTVDLTAPTAPSYTSPAALKVGVALTAMEASGGVGIDVYGVTDLPSGLSLDTGTGTISGTPDTANALASSATVTVSDAAGNGATVAVAFPAVSKGDQTLSGFRYSASAVAFGSSAPTVTAPTGVETTLSYSATPTTVCSVDAQTGALSLLEAGECVITATAAGTADYNEAQVTYTVTVQATGALVLNVDAITADGRVNIAEHGSGFAISGNTGSVGGVEVTVRVGETELTATSADADPASWSVDVAGSASYVTSPSVAVAVSAVKSGYTSPAAVEVDLTVDLTAPTAPSYTSPAALKVGVALTAMEASGGVGIDVYGVTDLPSGLSLDTGTGTISGTPDTANALASSATVTVSDAAGNGATVAVAFPAVSKGDQTLSGFRYSASAVAFGSSAPTVTAPTGVETTLSYSATPTTVCSVDAQTGALSLLEAGECVITATAAGTADYNEAQVTYTVTVQATGALVLNVDAITADGRVNIAEHGSGFAISGNTGSVGGVEVTVRVGETELTATSADADPASWSVDVAGSASYVTSPSVAVAVSAVKSGYTSPAAVEVDLTVDLTAPTAPSYTSPAALKVGVALTAMEASGGVGIDVYGVTDLPSGLSLDTGTGTISGTPDTANALASSATVTVSDAAGNGATVAVAFPAVSKGDQTLSGFRYSASAVAFGSSAPTVTAPTGVETTLSYSATPTTVCSVDAQTGALSLLEAGECVITATAAGTADYNEAQVTYTVTVQATGALVLNVDAITADGRVNIAEHGSGFAISGNTGSVGGVEVTVRVGETELTATSADADPASWSVDVAGSASYVTSPSVAVAVSAVKSGYTSPAAVEVDLTVDLTAPTAPSYTSPAALKVGVALTAMEASGGVGIDVYGVTDLPSGLSLDTGTGTISGTPDTANALASSATVTVSDAAGNGATVAVAFPAVSKGDQTLSGFRYSASAVAFGSSAPTVTAPTGVETTLSYSATPTTVCSVDAQTGALSLLEAGECVITATAAGTADYNEAQVTYTVTVQATGALVLNVDAITADGRVNIAEHGSGFAISGNTGSVGGVEVTVRVGETELTATSADADPASWSVDVAGSASYVTSPSVAVAVSAVKSGYTSPAAVEVDLTVDLTAPTAPSYTSPAALKVGVALTAMEASGGVGIDVYGVTDLPSGLSLDTGTGTISGTPDTANALASSATVTVSDAAGNGATVAVAFPAVSKGDQTLSGFRYSASAVAFGSSAPTVTAPTGVETTLSYSATTTTVCSVDAQTGALSLLEAGECVITATAAGTADYNEAQVTYTVTVQATGALVLNVDAITADGRVNIAEHGSGFAISGNTGSVGGVEVTVRVGETELTATSADADPASWSVDVAGSASYVTSPSVAVAVSAVKSGYTSPAAVEVDLTVDLTAPTAPSYTSPAALKVGVALTAMEASGGVGIDVYGVTDLPSGLSLDTGTGTISGTPDTANALASSATVTVSDAAGNGATVAVAFPAVSKGDQTLSGFRYSASAVAFGSSAPTVTAPTGVETTLSYSATPTTVCSVDAQTGALSLLEAGECVITATAAGTADYNEAQVTYTVTVQATGALVLNVDAITADGRVNIAEHGSGFAISGNTGSVGGVEVTVRVGETELTATSADADPASWSVDVAGSASYVTSPSVAVAVSAVKSGYTSPAAVEVDLTVDLTAPTAPSYTSPAALKVGVALTAMEASGGVGIDVYGVTDLPSGLSLDTGTGTISGTPDTANALASSATVTVSDAAGNGATVAVAFPAVSKGDQTLSGFRYSASAVAFGSSAPTVTAPTGVETTLSYSATTTTVCSVDAQTGALSLLEAGECVITATAAGTADYNEAQVTYTVTVQATGALVLNVDAITADGRVNIAEHGSGFAISGNTGSVGGVEVTVRVGETELTATSADADPASWSVDIAGSASYVTSPSVAVAVSAVKSGYTSPAAVEVDLTVDLTAPTAPSYTSPAALKVGVALTAMEASGGVGIDVYGVTDLPSGLSLDTGTGTISGTPDTANALASSATVTVSDAAGNGATVAVAFPAVSKGDQTLSGFRYSASAVAFGSSAPTVTAPTGVETTLSYSATTTTVCSVDAQTGALSLLEAGECVITATAAGTADYNEAQVTYTISVRALELVLSVGHTSVDENAGATAVTVTGTLIGSSQSSNTTMSVSIGASDDAAIAGTDYIALSNLNLTVPAGQRSGTLNFVFTPIDDLIVERVEGVSITGTSQVPGFNVTGTTLSIADNDERGVELSHAALTVPEDGDETYTVVLTSEPTGNVTVTPSVKGSSDVTVSDALTFTSTDWDEAQTITVSATPDTDAENETATIEHAVSGGDYEANSVTVDDVMVDVEDDETAVMLTVNPGVVDEADSGVSMTVTGTLDGATRSEPTTVTVSVGASDDTATQGVDYSAVNDFGLTIPPGQASATVVFTFISIEDLIDESDEAVSITGTSQTTGFDVTETTLTITDNDERGVQVSPTTLMVAEGGDETYTVVLTSEPTQDVTVTPSVNGSSDVTVSEALTFTSADWDEAQTITVSAMPDTDAENETATIEHAVSGGDYEANSVTVDDVTVTTEDDETAVNLTVNPMEVDESRSGIRVTVTGTLEGVTRSDPLTLTVQVGTADDAASEGADYSTVNNFGLTIPAGEASGTAVFTFRPMDDLIDESDEALSITGTIQIAGFDVNGTTLTIVDNDERGVTTSPATLVLEEGASTSYTVVLDTEPTDTVTVTPSVSGSPDVRFEPSSLTFTDADWDTAQMMTVFATEDDDAYHDSSVVSHVAEGAEYASLVDGVVSLTISDNEVHSQGSLPAQVTEVSTTASTTHVDISWSAVEDTTVVDYRVEASYDGGTNWAEIEASTENTDTVYRHDVGLSFAETRDYRISAVGENGAGLPSVSVPANATVSTGGLMATLWVPPEETDPMSQGTSETVPTIDVCWIPEGIDTSELSDIAVGMTPVYPSGSTDLKYITWRSIGSSESEVECEDGIGIRLTSISENQRYAFRMRAIHAGVWLLSNNSEATWVDASKPLRTVVTAGVSGLSGDTPVPALVCRDYSDPAIREGEEGDFVVSIGFTTAAPQYLRYELVEDFDISSDVTLVNATAQLLDQPYHTQLGYRVRITPNTWGEPVAVSLVADVVTHAATYASNLASSEFRRETADALDCDTSSPELSHRAQITAVEIAQDGNRDRQWTTGELIHATLQFDEPIRVTTTDGVPSVTLTLGEVATEVNAPYSAVIHEDTLVFEHVVTAEESLISDITLLADSLSLNDGEINSFSGPAVALAHPEANVVGGQIVESALTARWSMIPFAHDGSESHFEIYLAFSEDVDLIEVIGEQHLLEHAFMVTGGAIEDLWLSRDRYGEILANQWGMRVVPESEDSVTISPIAEMPCDQLGAICTIDDRTLSEAPSVTIHRTEQTLSVADAEVGEGPGAVLVFDVTLTLASDQTITVDYETIDGTATAGEDYEAAAGTLSIEAGQTEASVQINIIDDSHNEGEESLKLVLSNPSNAQIRDGEALGTIVNTDPIPTAWLARFGRAASDHVAQAVARRLERQSSETHVRVGNLRLDHQFTSTEADDGGHPIPTSTTTNLEISSLGSTRHPSNRWVAPGLHGDTALSGSGPNTGAYSNLPIGNTDKQWSSGDMTVPYGHRSRATNSESRLRDLLVASSFLWSYGGDEDATSSPVTVWGETASTRFKGSEGPLSLDGEVITAMLGLDKRFGRWLFGSTLSYSDGAGGYQRSGALGGSVASTLTSLNPYAHVVLNETTSLWGVFGYGSGSLRVTPEGAQSGMETDLSNLMTAFGGRGRLAVRSGNTGQFELTLRSDALLTRTNSEAVPGLVAAQGGTTRMRIVLEGSGSMPLSAGRTLIPQLEAGLRYDTGDAETGTGLEIGGGLGYTAAGLNVQVSARGLLVHDDSEYEEWGLSGAIVYAPSKDGRGLRVKLGSTFGVTSSSVQSMWTRQDASGFASNTAFDAAQRFQVELSYGIDESKHPSLWVPYFGVESGASSQALRLGVKLTSGDRLDAGLELVRRGSVTVDDETAVVLQGAIRL